TRSAEQVLVYLEQQVAHWEQHGFGWWAARERATGRFVGRGGVRHALVEGRTEVEVGYGLMSEFWGRGLATELARESVRVGFDLLHLPELTCFTLPRNLASGRVMEKAGFRYEKDVVYAGLPHIFFRQRREAWAAAHADR